MTKITLILTILVGILFGAIVQANAAQQVAIAGFRAPCITKQECKDETLVTLGIDEEQARALQPQWLWVATPRGYVWAYLTPGGPNGTIWGLVNRLHKSPEKKTSAKARPVTKPPAAAPAATVAPPAKAEVAPKAIKSASTNEANAKAIEVLAETISWLERTPSLLVRYSAVASNHIRMVKEELHQAVAVKPAANQKDEDATRMSLSVKYWFAAICTIGVGIAFILLMIDPPKSMMDILKRCDKPIEAFLMALKDQTFPPPDKRYNFRPLMVVGASEASQRSRRWNNKHDP